MHARKLLENAALGPDQLAILYKAFDEAWEVVRPRYDSNVHSTEVGRLRLANGVLAAYRDGVTEPTALTEAAIRWIKQPGS